MEHNEAESGRQEAPGAAAPGGAVESWFDLPAGVSEPFEVYLNGVFQQPGSDYTIVDRALVFARPPAPVVKMSRFQIAVAALGIAGTYKKYDSVDVIYERAGRRVVASGLSARVPAE
jgi:hypothetical protein